MKHPSSLAEIKYLQNVFLHLKNKNSTKPPSFFKTHFVISNKIDSSIEISIIRPNQPIIKVRVVSQSRTAPSTQDKATR